ELAPTDDEAFAELRRVYREASDFAALEELLRARMAATTNPPELVRLLGELAQLALERSDEPRRAMSLLRKALEVDAKDLPTLARLAALCDDNEQWTEALALYARAAAVATDRPLRQKFELRAAALWEKAGDLPQALAAYRQVLARAHDDHALERTLAHSE